MEREELLRRRQEALRQRHEFFRYPETMRDIVRHRQAIPLHTKDIVDQLLFLAQHPENAGVLDYDEESRLVPQKYRDDNEFFKHGQAVWMRRYGSMEDAMKDHVPFWIQREEAFAKLAEIDCPSGIMWKGLGRVRKPRKHTLVESVRAAKLLSRDLQSGNPVDRIRINSYTAPERRNAEGAELIVTMNSRSSDTEYDPFGLQNVPMIGNGTEYAVIQCLEHNHNCGKATNRQTYFQDKATQGMSAMFFCAHTIAAYWKIMSQQIKKDPKNETPMAMNPFAMPTKKALDVYNAARNSAMVWEWYVDTDGKSRHRHRPLHEAELEVVLWKLEKQYRHEQPFFATARDNYARYDWGKMRK